MKSILQKHKRCFVCGKTENLECHHIFYGTAFRHLSERYGLKVWLCEEHHRGNSGVHGRNRDLGLRLMRLAQRKFEEKYSRAEFMRLFKRNRLNEDKEVVKEDSRTMQVSEGVDNAAVFGSDCNVPGWDLDGEGSDGWKYRTTGKTSHRKY